MTQSLKFAFLGLTLVSAVGCARSQWHEDRGTNSQGGQPGGNATQTDTPPDTSLTPIAPPSSAPSAPALPGHRPPQAFVDCSSQTLSVEVATVKSGADLKDFWTTVGRYPQIKVTQVSKKKALTTFFLNPTDVSMHACKDQACAEAAGWSNIQNDFMDLNDVTVMCMGAPAPKPAPAPGPAPAPADDGSTDGKG
jgi:hypothetical protein